MTSWGQPREVRRWGKAGQRLGDGERNAAATKRKAEAVKHAQAVESRMTMARAAYERGEVKPWRITQALDLRGLHGPDVDRACGTFEPDVDDWEAGDLYPTWEQLLLLAKLTGVMPFYFMRGGEPLDRRDIHLCGSAAVMRESAKEAPEPVLQFTHAALVAAGIRVEVTPIARPRGKTPPPGRLF